MPSFLFEIVYGLQFLTIDLDCRRTHQSHDEFHGFLWLICATMRGVLLLSLPEGDFFLVLRDPYVVPLTTDLYQSNLLIKIWPIRKSKYFLNDLG